MCLQTTVRRILGRNYNDFLLFRKFEKLVQRRAAIKLWWFVNEIISCTRGAEKKKVHMEVDGQESSVLTKFMIPSQILW